MHQLLKVIALVIAIAPTLADAETLRGEVVAVYDGDTITIFAGGERHKIRVGGIDAPELEQTFGIESRDALRGFILHRTVTVEWRKRDRFGRIVGKIITHPQIDVGLALVRGGFAWHYKKYAAEQTPQDRERYARAEINARCAQRGLWADAVAIDALMSLSAPSALWADGAAIPPWEFRRGR